MSDRAEERKILVQFTCWLIGATILFLIIDIALSFLSNISMPGHVMNTILVWGCAMIAGDRHYRRRGELPTKMFSWRIAAQFTLINFALALLAVSVLLLILTAPSNGEAITDPLYDYMGGLSIILDHWWLMAAILALVTVVNLLVSRFGFSVGASSARTQAQKHAKRE